MSDDTLLFELVTPERLAVSVPVAMVEVPGLLGDFGVLPGHAPFMSIIRPGVVSVHEAADKVTRYFIPSGYAEVNPKGCTVLAEQVRDLAQLSEAQVSEELKLAQFAYDEARDEDEKDTAQQALMIAQALHQAVVAR